MSPTASCISPQMNRPL